MFNDKASRAQTWKFLLSLTWSVWVSFKRFSSYIVPQTRWIISEILRLIQHFCYLGFPGSSDSKESAWNEGDLGSTPDGENPLEEGMLTDSNILVWRIPWTEEPRRLESVELQRVRHDWVTNTFFFFNLFSKRNSESVTAQLQILYHPRYLIDKIPASQFQ